MESIVTDTKQIKAYIEDASARLVPLAANSVVLEFPSGDSLEVSWDARDPNDPRPICAEVWSGRRVSKPMSEEEIDAVTRATSVVMLPAAANVVLVYPSSYPVRMRT
jgi:hypothetical protein